MSDKVITTSNNELTALLAELRESLDRPLNEALSMPPQAYTSEALLEREVEKLFRRDWQCTGRIEFLPKPGDYYTYEVAGTPLIVHKNSQGEFKAFSNVCLHRMAPLVEGTGNAKRFVCPYHRWSYDEDGQLKFAPHAPNIDCSNRRLKEIKLEVWQGWIFVNLDDEAAPLAPRLTQLDALVGKYDMANMDTVIWEDVVWNTNWKLLAENFMESYHLFSVHPQTVQQVASTKSTRAEPGGDAYAFHWYSAPDSLPNLEGTESPLADMPFSTPLTHLSMEELLTGFDVDIFPATLIAYGAAGGFWILLQPQGVGQVRVRWGYSVPNGKIPKGAEGDAERAAIRRFMDQANAEDKQIVEGVYRSAKSPLAARSPLVMPNMEQPLAEFQRYLARRMD